MAIEVQERDRDKPLPVSSMQVEAPRETRPDKPFKGKPAQMHVQRRTDKAEDFGNGVAYESVSTKDPSVYEDHRRSSHSSASTFSLSSVIEFFTNHPSRLFLAATLFASILLVVLFSRPGGASICDDAKLEPIKYPNVNFEKVAKLKDKARHAAVKAENWIVLFVTGSPTEEVIGMVKLQGWQVLAIGDTQTPQDWQVPGAIFLSTDLQSSYRYKITSKLPYSSYVRKNIGYLFAVQHGAVRIYDADTGSTFLAGGHLGKSFDVDVTSKKTILQYKANKNRTLVNPFVHFGQRSVWPRGLSLTSVPNISPEVTYDLVEGDNLFIQQGLANGLPDVDSVFYHTRRLAGEPINVEFDHVAPSVALPRGTMAPVNSLNTLFHEGAFWAMMLPIGVHESVSDIFRGYFAQRLLWDVGGKVAFYPPSVRRIDTLEGSTFEGEEDLLQDWEKLIEFLRNWKSSKTNLFERILDLSYHMAKEGFWSAVDLDLTAAWLEDLVAVGYKPPKLRAVEDTYKGTRPFSPQVFKSVYPGVTDGASVEKEMGHLLRWRNFFDNIVLILECEWPLRDTVPAWRMLYGRLFKHVVVISHQAEPSLGVEAGAGWQTYTAFPGIFDRFPDADGFLFLKEHVVLNYWTMAGASKSKLWTMHEVKQSWNVYSFNDTGTSVFLKSSVKRTVMKTIYTLPDKLKATYRLSMDDTKFVHSTSDFFYIPKRLLGDFKDLASLGVQNKLAHELAMPLFFLAMDPPAKFDNKAFSKVLYLKQGDDPSSLYTLEFNVVYPWKASSETELFHIVKALSSGDHLLLAVL